MSYHPYHEWLTHFAELINRADLELAVCQHRSAHVSGEWSYNADSRLLAFNEGSIIDFDSNHYTINSTMPLNYCKNLLQMAAFPKAFKHMNSPSYLKNNTLSGYFKQPPVPYTLDWLDNYVLHPYSMAKLTYHGSPEPQLTLKPSASYLTVEYNIQRMTTDLYQLVLCFFFTLGRWITDFPLVAEHKRAEPTFSCVEDLFL